MQIQSVQNQTFKGYDARPIKALYMQKAPIITQNNIYKELYKIGEEEGFDVYMNYHSCDKIASKPSELKKHVSQSSISAWAQDNKIFINKDGDEAILYPLQYKNGSNNQAPALAKKIDVEPKLSSVQFQGGNIFVGTKDNGENYILIGTSTLKENLISYFSDEVRSAIGEYMQGKEPTEENKEIREEIEEVLKKFGEEFNIKDENIFVINQPDFHLDMSIRPLKYPYVLVNDFNKTNKAIDEMKVPQNARDEHKNFQLSNAYYGYATTDDIETELKNFGFKPIRIAGVFSDKVNFMNAVVHEKPDGSLIYITNSSKCERPNFNEFQDTFEKELKEKCEDISKVYFVSGGKSDEGKNNALMDLLGYYSGGLHCLVAEEPKVD